MIKIGIYLIKQLIKNFAKANYFDQNCNNS